MAGGIDWFRWHHGSVTDPKFGLVARKAGCRTSDVIAMWACILEAASMAEPRGTVPAQDFEAIDFALGFDEGMAQAIYGALCDRRLVAVSEEAHRIAAWGARQPKREREDDGAAERKRRQRERDAANGEQVTPRHASSRQETPREEESREEKEPIGSSSSPDGDDTATVRGMPMPCPQERIRELYAEILPMLPQPKLWTADRQKALRSRWGEMAKARSWRSQDDGIDWFRRFFEAVVDNDFLMGRTKRSPEHANWEPDIDYLLSPKGFRRVVETAGRQRETA